MRRVRECEREQGGAGAREDFDDEGETEQQRVGVIGVIGRRHFFARGLAILQHIQTEGVRGF